MRKHIDATGVEVLMVERTVTVSRDTEVWPNLPLDAWRERERAAFALCRMDLKGMVDEVEIDLNNPRAVRHRRRGEPAGRDVERHAPPVADHRRERQSDFPDDLHPHVERRIGLSPRVQRQVGPDFCIARNRHGSFDHKNLHNDGIDVLPHLRLPAGPGGEESAGFQFCDNRLTDRSGTGWMLPRD